MVDAHAELDFLIRSENRVTVLSLLARRRYSERELVETTEMSKTTVNRILEDFTERGWIEEADEAYTTTRFGDVLADDYERFRESMDLASRLGPYRHLLPMEEMGFDLRLLTDAKVTDPDRLDTLQSVDRWTELIRQADRVRFLANTANEPIIRTTRNAIVEDDTAHESVFTPALYDYIRKRPGLCEMFREMLREGASFYRAADGTDMPWFIALYDDLVGVGGFDESGTVQTGFESDAEPVFEWAEGTFESHRVDATPLTVEDFPVE
jgi:predicted transcriptional regulator